MENYQNQKTSKLGLVGRCLFGAGIFLGLISNGCTPAYNEKTDGRMLSFNYSGKPECSYVADTVTGEYWENCPGLPTKKYQLSESQRIECAEKVRELMSGQGNQTEKFLMGGLLGMAASGAGDIGQPRRDLALRGVASGLQNAQQNDAIRNSGQVNVNVNTGTNNAGLQPQNTGQTSQLPVVGRDEPLAQLLRSSESLGIGLLGCYDLNRNGAIDVDEASIKNVFVADETIFMGTWLSPYKKKLRFDLYEMESKTQIPIATADSTKYRDGVIDKGMCFFITLPVNSIGTAYSQKVQGTKKYEVMTYLDDDNQPFATRTFDINWDLKAEDVYRK